MELQLTDSTRQVAEQLAAILTEYLKNNPGDSAADSHVISPETNMVTDLQLDSFQVMEFMLEIEDHYDVAIDLVSLSKINTIAELAAVVIAAQQE